MPVTISAQYNTVSQFEADTQPFLPITSLVARIMGVKEADKSTHSIDLKAVCSTLIMIGDPDWRYDQELKNPSLCHAYRSNFPDARLLAMDINSLNMMHHDIDILDSIRGLWALDFLNVLAARQTSTPPERIMYRSRIHQYIQDSRAYKAA